MSSDAMRVAPLRDELILHPGPTDWQGAPSWTLEDPLRDRYYRIGWLEKTLLSHWSLGDANAIITRVNQQLPVDINQEDIRLFSEFLQANALTWRVDDETVGQFSRQKAATKRSWWSYALHNYLFLRIPILHPDALLKRTLPWVSLFYNRFFWLTTFVAGLTGLLFASRQWETFRHTFLHFFTLEGALLAGITLSLTKFIHELGHAYTCKRYGGKVSSMGIALLVMMPVLYTDTSSAWKIASRKQRLTIGAAGMLSELAIAAWATLAWSFLPDGMLRSAAFMLATTTWIMTLAVNLSPLMRFDGYFLLSDAIGIGNLQQRGFAVGRWKLRELLFGLQDAPPEAMPDWLRRVLTCYAFSTWVYRLFLFTGIALLVYHMTFKVLGILLFAVEIGYFIILPITNELRAWHGRRKDYRMNRQLILTLSVCSVLLLILFFPWQHSVYAPGLIRAEQQGSLYMPIPAKIEQIKVSPGQQVMKGDVLFILHTDDMVHQNENLTRQLQTLGWQQEYQTLNRQTLQTHQRIRKEREAALKYQQVLSEQRDSLIIRSPLDGRVADLANPLSADEWLAQGEWLATVTHPEGALVEALVEEKDWLRLAIGAKGTFYSKQSALPSVQGEIVEIEQTAVTDLRSVAELASVYGGDIAALTNQQREIVPEQAVYRVLLRLDSGTPAPLQVQPGTLALEGQPQILAVSLWKHLSAVMVRELTF